MKCPDITQCNPMVWLLAMTLAVLLAGCSGNYGSARWGWPWNIDSVAGNPLNVQNCALVGISSPSKFACDGKVYTTFQLADIREKGAKPMPQSGASSFRKGLKGPSPVRPPRESSDGNALSGAN
ncbi:MAG: hypothetical protein ACREP6_04360 [Candidatus Binataceae bacterium]